MTFLTFSVLLLLLQICFRTASAQQVCSSALLTPYKECVTQNSPCPCSACHPDPTDGTLIIGTRPVQSCNDIEAIFCPLVKCCSLCETQARLWYETCSGGALAQQFLGMPCSLQCDKWLAQDRCDATDRPTRSPVESPSAGPSGPVVEDSNSSSSSSRSPAPTNTRAEETTVMPSSAVENVGQSTLEPTLAPSVAADETDNQTVPTLFATLERSDGGVMVGGRSNSALWRMMMTMTGVLTVAGWLVVL